MSFLRPDAIAAVLRWREILVGVAAVALGAWWAFTSFGVLRWIGVAVALGGIAIATEGLRRARWPGRGGGPGVVEVLEGQITYLAPENGGAVAMSRLTRVEIEAIGGGRMLWHFTSEGPEKLTIPGDAEGTEALHDALNRLPGADLAKVSRAASARKRAMFLIWERTPDQVPVDYRLN